MNVQKLITEAIDAGVTLHLINGAIKVRGTPDAVKAMTANLRTHKAAILEYLTAASRAEPEIWGEYTQWVAPISPELVTELHRLIAEYAALYRLADDETARIIEAAKRQPAATVPESMQWFQRQVGEKS